MTVFSAESLVAKGPLSTECDMEDENLITTRIQDELVEEDEISDSDDEEGDYPDIELNSLPPSPTNKETRGIDRQDHEHNDSQDSLSQDDKNDKQETEDSSVKPTHSYIALIAMAILSSPSKKMILGDIYQYIQDKYPYYRNKDKSWRNSIRHNLSLNECFIKAGRSENGKGNYWGIHPVNMDDFANGDFRRRRARRRVRKTAALKFGSLAGYGFSPFSSHTPIMSYRADRFCPYPIPCHSHVTCTKNFAIESILSPHENTQFYSQQAHRPLHLPPFHLPPSNSSYSSIALNVPAPNGIPAVVSPLSAYSSISPHRLSPYSAGCTMSAPTESWQETLEKLQAQFRKSAHTAQHS